MHNCHYQLLAAPAADRLHPSQLLLPLPLPLLPLVLILLVPLVPPFPVFWPFLAPSPSLAFACAPPPPSLFGTNVPNPTENISPRQPANSRAFGEQIHRPPAANELAPTETAQNGVGEGAIEHRASTASGPVKEPRELFCYDFDDKCRWRNMEGFLVDDLDWYQGAGFLDENRLRLATGTHISPDGFYGITATDKVELSGTKGILVSDVIQCQTGNAELRFMYWTSPEVKITICVKSVLRLFPYFDYCSTPVENNDPGPAYITLPDLGGEPLQIFIQAQNFVFNSAALQGGFAIIDNLEYYGEFCDSEQQHFAQSNSARSENAPRLSPLPKDSAPAASKADATASSFVWGPELIYNSVIDGAQQAAAAGGGGGFSSLLDWMLYGGGGGLLGGNGNGTAAAAAKATTTAGGAPTLPNAPLFELNPGNIFPTLLPPPAEAVGALPAAVTAMANPLLHLTDQQMPSFSSSTPLPSIGRPSAAVVQKNVVGESGEVVPNAVPHQRQQKPPTFFNTQILAAQKRRSSAEAPAGGGLRSLRIVQQKKQKEVDRSSSKSTENDGQQQSVVPGSALEQKTHRSGQRQQQHSSRRLPLPHLALLNQRRIEEEEELRRRRRGRTEVVPERDETEGDEEEGGRVGMTNRKDDDDQQEER